MTLNCCNVRHIGTLTGDVIRHFWEEKAFDENGNPVAPLDKCINKIGHALHDLNPKFQRVSYEGRVGTICKELGVSVRQSNPLYTSTSNFKLPGTHSCTINVHL